MIESFASKIWVRVRFIAFCVISQQFHPPMYFRTLKNCRVNDINCLKTKFLFCKGFSNQTRHVPIIFKCATYEVLIPQMFFAPDKKR